MTTKYLLSIDPGLSSGIFLGSYSDTEPLTRVAVWQFGDKGDTVRGVEALVFWLKTHWTDGYSDGESHFEYYGGLYQYGIDPYFEIERGDLTVIAEKFAPLSGQGHSLTLAAVEPLRCEGALIALGLMPAEFPHERWQRPAAMYFSGGGTLPAKKKASRAWLKSHGLLPTGKDVGQPNADDAVSSSLHAFAYMRKIRHEPSLANYWPDDEKEDS